jgi:P27 family predicted phage terminase small subunit
MGKRKQPAQAKVIKGTFQKCRDSHGPAVKLEVPPCPEYLGKEAKKYWKEISEQLVNVGLIGVVDGALFGLHCDSYGRLIEVSDHLKKMDDMLDQTPNGLEVQSALWQIRNKLWDQVLRSASEFGLSPAARSKLSMPEKPSEKKGGWSDV